MGEETALRPVTRRMRNGSTPPPVTVAFDQVASAILNRRWGYGFEWEKLARQTPAEWIVGWKMVCVGKREAAMVSLTEALAAEREKLHRTPPIPKQNEKPVRRSWRLCLSDWPEILSWGGPSSSARMRSSSLIARSRPSHRGLSIQTYV